MTQNRVLATAAMAMSLATPFALQAQQTGSASAAAPAMAPAPAPDSGPSSIAYKGVHITPIGFFAAEALWRERNETADMGSSYNGIPFDKTPNGQTSEFRMSGRQSRIGLLVEGKLSDTKLSGYWESDFLSSGTTSNSNESNSYTLRLRQFFGQAAFNNGVTVSAGQMWSLLTTDKMGLSPRKEAVPLTIDAQYVPGFDWARQAALRVTTKLGDHAAFGIAAEEPQMTVAVHNSNPNYLLSYTGGSQLNSGVSYSTDLAPDLVAKLAFDGAHGHFEIKAIGRAFRDRMYSTNDSVGSMNTVYGGGIGFGALWSFGKMADLGISGLWGRGIGRYGTSQLADVTVDSAGKIVPIVATHGLVTLELHPTPKLDVYVYGGGEYEGREAFTNGAGVGEGYGSPLFTNAKCDVAIPPTGPNTAGSAGSCTNDAAVIYQGTIGYWYRFYKGPGGTMQWGTQYSYTGRQVWSGVGGHPTGNDGMAFTSIRYYIP